jgi:hypothetical protein
MNLAPISESLQTLANDYFPGSDVVEITDRADALKDIASKTASCFGAGTPIGDTGWMQLASPSPHKKGVKPTIYVCKTSLLELDSSASSRTEKGLRKP